MLMERTGQRTLSQRAAAWTLGLSASHVPADVRASTVSRVLDILGLSLAGATRPPGEAAHRAVRQLGQGSQARVLWFGDRTSASLAALANGTMAHSLEYDDTHNETIVHVSVPLVTCALVVGDMLGTPGDELVTAIAAAAEMACRIGVVTPGRLEKVGFHPTAIAGAMSCTLLVARLYGLTEEQTVHALGIAGSKAAGLMECWSDGTWSKFIHPGISAETGIVACTMAREGFKGPATVFEGRFGLFRSHVQDPAFQHDTARMVTGLGENWESRNISFKPYPCGHVIHPFLDALLAMVREDGLRAEDVERITCPVAAFMAPIVCEPVEEKLRPRSDWQGRVSLPFSLADALIHGRCNVHNFAPESLTDPAVLGLALRIHYRIDETAPGREQFKGWVIAELKDGRVLERVQPHNWGSRENPMTAADVEEKFRVNATTVLTPERAEQVVQAVRGIDAPEPIRDLISLCIRQAPSVAAARS